EDSTAAPVIWLDPGLLVPAAVSLTALALTIATIVLCLKRRSSGQMSQQQISMSAQEEKSELRAHDQVYSTIRRLPAPEPPLYKDLAHGDYSEEEIYPYATATFQLRGTPPPPSPPSPRSHGQQHRSQKEFTAMVYQPPSLHDVDSPNTSGRKKPMHHSFPYEESEIGDYGTSLRNIDPRTSNRRPRQPRVIRNSAIEHLHTEDYNLGW
ncbi:unnamed protein product, partial [Meganyctiphanes norvegica]